MKFQWFEIYSSSKPFGGLYLILRGDLFQLKPVFYSSILQNQQFGYHSLATNIWKDHLTKIRRQDNQEFALLLNRMREGHLT